MKPKPIYFRSTALFGTPLRCGVPAFVGFTVLVSGLSAAGGDLLRGGRAGSNMPGASAAANGTGAATAAATDAARANAQDTLARTTHALDAMRAMQNAARNAAISGANPLAQARTTAALTLPVVPNGLASGGLQVAPVVATDPTKWSGAHAPTQSVATDGSTQVGVTQTTQQALLTWQTFNVGKQTTLTFDQSAGGANVSQWIAFNKVSDPSGNPSQILGSINAAGQVYIINQNGIIFGGSSQVNAHTLAVSAIPINDTLIANGLLSHPGQFLFDGLSLGKIGDITVEAGSRISSPVSADGNGGCVILAGANVTNAGTITTPNGQTLLAAGLQVGLVAHASADPAIRGLDVYVGAVSDPASTLATYAGSVTHSGLLEAALGNITLAGKDVYQLGILESSTSVALNGSVRLLANYAATTNLTYDAANSTTGTPFNYNSAGSVLMGGGSLTRVLPDYQSTDLATGTELALSSQIFAQGTNIHLANGAVILAPGAKVSLQAGAWTALASGPSAFVHASGQIYLDDNALINVAGTADATASVLQTFLSVTLRGSELAVAPLQRAGVLRGDTIVVDSSLTGTYNGRAWVGTPLADVSGYLGLIERDAAQLTTAGGSVDLAAGGSVVVRGGATLDVSGGWTNFTGATVQTTRVWANGHLVDIASATPDQLYSGAFTGVSTFNNSKWGVTESFKQALAPGSQTYQAGYTSGAAAGSIAISTPELVLDGTLRGSSVVGTRQSRATDTTSQLPAAASLSLNLQAQILSGSTIYTYSPTRPGVIFGTASQPPAADFSLNPNGEAPALDAARSGTIYLSPALLTSHGFGNLTVLNEGGDIVLPEDVTLNASLRGGISLTAANINVQGTIYAPGGSITLTALDLTSYQSVSTASDSSTPAVNPGRGMLTVGPHAVLSSAGTIIDDRAVPSTTLAPLALGGGSVNLAAYTANLQAGGLIDVSGGYLLNSLGKGTFGNGGVINIAAGKDPGQHTVLGGTLTMDATMRGFSGAKGGTLSLLAPRIQIGGTSSEVGTLLLNPGFFSQGGFSDFKLTGLGVGLSPGVLVTGGTRIEPVVESFSALNTPVGSNLPILQVTQDIPSTRPPVNLTLTSPGVKDLTTVEIGDVVVADGARIITDAGGSVSVSGGTVAIFGTIIAAGGTISVTGGSTSVFGTGLPDPEVTTYLGSGALLSVAGSTVPVPDAYGRRSGKVWAGGTISIAGNIAVANGGVLDASGTSATLDIATTTVTAKASPIQQSSGLTSDPGNLASVPVKVDSDGGTIVLSGGELLYGAGTLLANAGGSTALGGSLVLASGVFDPTGNGVPASTVNLTVTQTAAGVSGPIGTVIGNGGHFALDSFTAGGFDSLTLNGVVAFSGAVDLTARQELNVASGGFLVADASVSLAAPHVTLGQAQAVVLPGSAGGQLGASARPAVGAGRLTVTASLIDIGQLSLEQIGSASLIAADGDIRGSGTLQLAGDLTLGAGHIYPNNASQLSFIAYDHLTGGVTHPGSILVSGSGTRGLPLSAGGTLSLYASSISQQGTLRAPGGTILLGWDGTGTTPVEWSAGAAATFPITSTLTLGTGSVTSVSAIDPLTGHPVTLPYGVSTDGTNWIDPHGVDITTSGPPVKSIVLSAASVTTASGSTIDLRGGGDLYAYRWVAGLGGASDILASTTRFAILPTYASTFAPVAEFNTSSDPANLIAGNSGSGYANPSLRAGNRIYLAGSNTLAAGYYTLLPARYALLPGALLVSPTGGGGSTTVEMPDSSSIVSGYIFNSLNSAREVPTISSRFEVAPAALVRSRAQYEDHLANPSLAATAQAAGMAVPRLPADSGYLVFEATRSMDLRGTVASAAIANGRGAAIDISTPLDTVITAGPRTGVAGTIYLDSGTLTSFAAETLLIGGRRSSGPAGDSVAVGSNNLTVSNAGAELSAEDLILVANGNITIDGGSALAASGTFAGSSNLILAGNGTLLRVAAEPNAGSVRTGITSAGSALLSIGSHATLSGGSVVLDSSGGISLDSAASLQANSYQFDCSNISLVVGASNPVLSGGGLVVSNTTLQSLGKAAALTLLSYGSIDLYGSGSFGSTATLSQLTLSAGQIRGVDTGGGTTQIAAKDLRLENTAADSSNVAAGSGLGNLTLVGDVITLGRNNLAINGYASVTLDAASGISGEGSGGLAIQGNLTANTPMVTGTGGANRSLAAGGILSIATPQQAAGNALASGLGSALTITGGSISIDSVIALPSGSLTLSATAGDLTVNSLLDVSGTTQRLQDVTKVTSAGTINLAAPAGNIRLNPQSTLNLSAPALGGNGGTLSVSTPAGSFCMEGKILGGGGAGGTNGSLSLDVLALPTLADLSASLTASGLVQSQLIRVRTGNVTIGGTASARDFELAADQGSINVIGTIDASGANGGTIRLAAHGDLAVASGAHLTVAGLDFDRAGQGGAITLEAGSQLNGVAGSGAVDIQSGSVLDLSVASRIGGSANSAGTSAYNGRFSGKLHIRAPRNATNSDLPVKAINGTIVDASSILVEGYKTYDLTSSGGSITSSVQGTVRTDASNYLGAAGTTTATYTAILNRLLANNSGLADALVLAAGVEIINRSGDVTLGSATSTTASDWNLSTYRFGAKSAAGVLTIRAAGNIVLYNALSDGFSPTLASSDATWLWSARLTSQSALLPVNAQSWSYRLAAGADLGAAAFGQVLSGAPLAAGSGSLKLGKSATNVASSSGASATTASAVANRYQVIRTGSGDIEIYAARSVQLLNQFATIYTAGTRVADPTMGGVFRLPSLSLNGMDSSLGSAQQASATIFSMAGGDVSIHAGENIEHLTLAGGQWVADSQLEMPNNWLYRRGYVDAASSAFGVNRWGEAASTSWWVDFSNFFQGVGALGGGDVRLVAGHNISNVDAVIPTNARMPGYTDGSQTIAAAPDAAKLLELGGGNLSVAAGNNIDAGVYYVESGNGTLTAGGSIVTNATRSVLTQSNIGSGQETAYTELPTSLFVGNGGFTVSARGDILLGPVANPFLLPGGLLNSFWQKSYFATYASQAYLTVGSLGGDVSLRSAATLPGQTTGAAISLLQSWFTNKLQLSSLSAASNKPWLRLDETTTAPFQSLFALRPGSLRATAFNGSINVVGDLTLAPSAQGTLELLAGGAINGFQPNGVVTLGGVKTLTWGSSTINVSDADPAAIPGIGNPFGYQQIAGTTNSASLTGRADFLAFLSQHFAESGGRLGNVLQTEQALHAAGLLHLNDPSPLRLYADGGDISGLTVFSPKPARVLASQSIADVALYIQNVHAGDVSVVASGQDLTPYQAASTLRIAAQQPGNGVNIGSGPQAGDIQISGPGALEVLAGHNLDLGTGSGLADGTGAGITSIGNARNPYLPFAGAEVTVSAGLGLATGLANSGWNLADFITRDVLTPEGGKLLDTIAPGVVFADLSAEDQARLALEVFYRILRDAGRAHAATGDYRSAGAAIELLFGTQQHGGNILARARNIRSTNGGDISIIIPGGGLELANSAVGNTLSPPGIITESGGNIAIFANSNVSIGIGRIFTLRGGDELIWSSVGDIAAGSSSKTVKSASPTRVLIDPQSAAVQTDLSGLATGGGIGVLATVKGVPAGNVDLIAPLGTVDAGDAGIRVSGNLNIAANLVLNTANIATGGSSAGASAPVAVSVAVTTLTSAAGAVAAGPATGVAAGGAAMRPSEPGPGAADQPSFITVEVTGYGASPDDDGDE